jgi:hypothetical protein
MKRYEKEFPRPDEPLIVGFDVEWTKNYQRKNANRAFCFSLVWVRAEPAGDLHALEQTVDFGFWLGYSETEEECLQLCQDANGCIGQMLTPSNVVVGHQFSSDLSVLLACSEDTLPAIETLQHCWRTRQHPQQTQAVGVFDTRYDLPTSKNGQSNKLVHVCPTWNLIVTQPEIKGSMTRMQRDFYQHHSLPILERIAVLNLRHSLSSVLLYLFHRFGRPSHPVNINTILHRNLAAQFEYVRSARFASLLTDVSQEQQAAHASVPLPVLTG